MTQLARRDLLKLPVCLVPLPELAAEVPVAVVAAPFGLVTTLERALYIMKLHEQGRVSFRTACDAMDAYTRARFGGAFARRLLHSEY